jgi:hypothetical protein
MEKGPAPGWHRPLDKPFRRSDGMLRGDGVVQPQPSDLRRVAQRAKCDV